MQGRQDGRELPFRATLFRLVRVNRARRLVAPLSRVRLGFRGLAALRGYDGESLVEPPEVRLGASRLRVKSHDRLFVGVGGRGVTGGELFGATDRLIEGGHFPGHSFQVGDAACDEFPEGRHL